MDDSISSNEDLPDLHGVVQYPKALLQKNIENLRYGNVLNYRKSNVESSAIIIDDDNEDVTIIEDDGDEYSSQLKGDTAVILCDSDNSNANEQFTSSLHEEKMAFRQKKSIKNDFYSDGSDSNPESAPGSPISKHICPESRSKRDLLSLEDEPTYINIDHPLPSPYSEPWEDCYSLGDSSTKESTADQQSCSQSSSLSYGTDSVKSAASPGGKRKRRTPEEVAAAKKKAEMNKKLREEELLKKRQEREEKAREKEHDATRRRMLQQSRRAERPGECIKHLTIMLDSELIRLPWGARLLGLIQERDYRFDIQKQPHPHLVTFWREVTEAKDAQNKKLEMITREIVEDQVVAWLPLAEFVQLVHAQHKVKRGVGTSGSTTLRSYIQAVKRTLENRDLTILVQGMEKYHRDQKGKGGCSRGRGRKVQSQAETSDNQVSRLEVEEALVDVQLHTGCNIRFTETDDESARTILQYAKAVAETPFKRARFNKAFNLHVDTASSVKIDKDGHGVVAAWRLIIQHFKSIGAEVANAIMAVYPTPRQLYEAYQGCTSEAEASKLLENIVVRRGYGVMETNRRVGKELSKKMHTLFTSLDPEVTIK